MNDPHQSAEVMIGWSVYSIRELAEELTNYANQYPELVRRDRKAIHDAWNALGFILNGIEPLEPEDLHEVYGEAAE